MNERNAIWNDLPPGLDEHMLLAWVEDQLPAQQRARVEEALRARPALLGRLDAMRSDRHTLRSLGEERAPAYLMESIEETLERDALLGLASGQDLLRSPPVSTVVVRRPALGVMAFIGSRAGRRLALAAAVALVAGAAVWLGPQLLSPAPAPREPVMIAQSELEAQAPEAAHPVEPAPPAPEPVIAAAPEPPAHSAIELPGPAPMRLDRAVALAAEGRLAIRVGVERYDIAMQRVAQLVERPGRRGWRLGRDDAGAAVALLPRIEDFGPGPLLIDPGSLAVSALPPAPGLSRPVIETGDTTMAGGSGAGPLRAGRSYVARFALTEASLGRLLDQLAARAGAEPEMEELAAPLWLAGPLSADAILWWGGGADAVGSWGAAPVLIEPRE